MPVYEQSYRRYEGEVRRRGRWWTIVAQEISILGKSRPFRMMVLAAALHFLLRLFQVIAYDTLRTQQNNPVIIALQQLQMMRVDGKMFSNFIRIQAPLMMITMLYAGAGMICSDVRNNLLEVYFAKPIRWQDYALGKFMTLVLIGLSMTGMPALLLLILHNSFVPGWKTLSETAWLALPITGFSLAVVVPCALCILAGSSLFKSQRFAAIAFFMLLFADMTLGGLLAELMNNPRYLVTAVPIAIYALGDAMFREHNVVIELAWGWCALYVAVVAGAALAIVCHKARRAEVAR